jgi:hypothetical protein
MKKNILAVVGMASMLAASCGTLGTGVSNGTTGSSTGNVLGSVIGAMSNGEAIGNVLSSVIGLNQLSQSQLIGTWRYNGPGCAFTSDNLLAKAGGEVAATQIEQKLEQQYAKLGFSSSNTYITFNQDGTFASKIGGKSFSGNYTYDAGTGALNLKGLLLSLNGYATRNGSGISVLFESKKLLSLLQTMAALSGNSTLSTIGEVSKNYDGARLGFDMSR